MKRIFKKFTDLEEKSPTVFWVILASVGYILYKLISYIIAKFQSGLASASAKGSIPIIEAEQNADKVNGIRTNFCEGVAGYVYEQVNSFLQDEVAIVTQLNLLNNAYEAGYCSKYYQDKYSHSLKADLSDALDANWRNATGGTYLDLKVFIQNSLF